MQQGKAQDQIPETVHLQDERCGHGGTYRGAAAAGVA